MGGIAVAHIRIRKSIIVLVGIGAGVSSTLWSILLIDVDARVAVYIDVRVVRIVVDVRVVVGRAEVVVLAGRRIVTVADVVIVGGVLVNSDIVVLSVGRIVILRVLNVAVVRGIVGIVAVGLASHLFGKQSVVFKAGAPLRGDLSGAPALAELLVVWPLGRLPAAELTIAHL